MEPNGSPFASMSIGKCKYNLISVRLNKISEKISQCLTFLQQIILGVINTRGKVPVKLPSPDLRIINSKAVTQVSGSKKIDVSFSTSLDERETPV